MKTSRPFSLSILLAAVFIFASCIDMGGGGGRDRSPVYSAPSASVLATDVCQYAESSIPEGCICDPSSGKAMVVCEGEEGGGRRFLLSIR